MSRYLAIFAVALFASLAMGQEVPFDGIVIQDNTQARAGAGNRFYVVGTLPKGQAVRVEEVFYGWNMVACPPGVYSYISKAFVDAKGDGKVGVVNADRQDVKAASIKGPGESYRTQTILNKGDEVQIVGEAGSFYKIVPPKDAYVFLPPGTVQRADQVNTAAPPVEETPEEPEPVVQEPVTIEEPVATEPEVAEPVVEEPEVTEPVAVETPDEEVIEETATTEEPVVEEDPAADLIEPEKGGEELVITSDSLTELEAQMFPLFAKPADEQPIDQMKAAYEALDPEMLTPDEQRIVRLRLAALERNRKLAEALNEIAATRKEIEEEKTKPTDEGELPPADYSVVGTLSASAVYSGESLPRLYRVLGGDGRTLGWVPPGGKVDARQHLGELVGIVGKKQYDDALKLHIYSVERIDLLEASE